MDIFDLLITEFFGIDSLIIYKLLPYIITVSIIIILIILYYISKLINKIRKK